MASGNNITIATILALVGLSPIQAQVVTVTPWKDAEATEYEPMRNLGACDQAQIQSQKRDSNEYYFCFAVDSVEVKNKRPVKGELTFKVVRPPNNGMNLWVFRAGNEKWDQGMGRCYPHIDTGQGDDLTWNNRPGTAGMQVESWVPSNAAEILVDVTNFIPKDACGPFSLCLAAVSQSPGEQWLVIHTDEAAEQNKPRLAVTYCNRRGESAIDDCYCVPTLGTWGLAILSLSIAIWTKARSCIELK